MFGTRFIGLTWELTYEKGTQPGGAVEERNSGERDSAQK